MAYPSLKELSKEQWAEAHRDAKELIDLEKRMKAAAKRRRRKAKGPAAADDAPRSAPDGRERRA